MPTKYYAVRKGKKPGIYQSWEKCKQQVNGVPGAEYKSFLTESEAKNYLNHKKSPTPTQNQTSKHTQSPDSATAYVDGSYDNKTKRFSYGCIIFYQNEKTALSRAYSDTAAASMHNVAGEILGALAAMKWCVQNNISNLHLYYDYEGIEKWCTGAWRTKNPHTQKYKEIYDRYTTKDFLKVTFHKVQAHTGVKYNEEADKLAKQTLKQSNLKT